MTGEPDVERIRRLDRWVFAVCAAFGVVIFLAFRGLRHDDAYITFQYARSIAEGDGFVFNQGERVLGTTTPLFTLIMAAIYWIAGDILAPAAIAVSAIAIAVQGGLVWILGRDRAPITAATLALLVMLGFGGLGVLALETSLYTMLVLATIVALDRSRATLAGVCLGLAFLTRYDAGLLVLVVAGWQLALHRKLPVRTLLVSLAVVAPWLLFAQTYFGSVFPHTLGAKTSITPMWEYLHSFTRRWLQIGFGLEERPLAGVIVVTCSLLGLRWMWNTCRACVPLVIYCVLHVVAYAWIGPDARQLWHTHLPLLVGRLLVAAGILGTLEGLLRSGSSPRLRRGATITVAIASIAMTIATVQQTMQYARKVGTSLWFTVRHERYQAVAGWLALHVKRDRTLMATEFGTLGYLTRRHMFDPFGLINWTNDWPWTRSPTSKRLLVERFSPDVILFDSIQEANASISIGYRSVHEFPWGSPWSVIVVRDFDVLTPLGRTVAATRQSP